MNDVVYTDVGKRHDFILIFDVIDGNPNGDPDAGNLPRVDPETMQGLLTDVCIKRKIRDYVNVRYGTSEEMKIYVERRGILNAQHERAYSALGMKSTGAKQKWEDVDGARDWMCRNFYDVRMFGAVMSTGVNCGQVKGPMQLTFARSVNPVVPLDLSITRVAVTRSEDARAEDGTGKETEMGRKPFIPYGLFRGYGFFNPHFGEKTGVSADDLKLFWEALQNMWDLDRSASRGLMSLRGLYIFSHQSRYGNAPAHLLFERLQLQLKDGVKVPRSFKDYDIVLDCEHMPEGVTLTKLV